MSSNTAKILVALICVIAVVAGAIMVMKRKVEYTGRVTDDRTGAPIKDAKVSVEEDQKVPQIQPTDSEGIFHLWLPASAKSVRLRVEARNYVVVTRNVPLIRTGLEEIRLPLISNPTPESVSFSFTNENPSLEEVCWTVSNGSGAAIYFNPNCDKSVGKTRVSLNGAQLDGKDVKDVLENALARANVRHTVRIIKEGISYEIVCGK